MALIDCRFYSDALELSTSMTVILPQNTETQIGMKNAATGDRHKTLYLLHGLSDDHTIWSRRTAVERYVAPLGIAVVMPAVHRSFYTNMRHGGAYRDFIADELPGIARSFFPLSDRREDTYVAGLSMGGYGALMLGLSYPERYCAAASLSGALDVATLAADPDGPHRGDWENVFGENPSPKGGDYDLYAAVGRAKKRGAEVPRLFLCCGKDDGLFEQNVRFRDFLRTEGLKPEWRADAGYAHTWDYWDLRIRDVLAWMFGSGVGA